MILGSVSALLGSVSAQYYAGMSVNDVIGKFAWVRTARRDSVSSIVYETYSDQAMFCPAAWEGGFKDKRVLKWGTSELVLSEEWRGSTFKFSLSDEDCRFRRQLVSPVDRFWVEDYIISMTTEANRGALGLSYRVFVGSVIDAQPVEPLGFDYTLGDIISESIMSDENLIPFRIVRDGFVLRDLNPVADFLDLDGPEPRIYGQHRRIPDVHPPSPQGFIFMPIYLGIEGSRHVWMICGHAVSTVPDGYVRDSVGLLSSILPTEGTTWFLPGHSIPLYEDRRSVTYGDMLRYALMYGTVGHADPDACVLGTKTLLVAVDGVELNGDGTGAIIIDRAQQIKHFMINDVAHFGADSYRSGPWLLNPSRDVMGQIVPIIDEASYDECSARGLIRLPPDGYIGAWIIGARPGDRDSVRRWYAEANRSCGMRGGASNLGEIRVAMIAPTTAIKATAKTFLDRYEILINSFGTNIEWKEHANRIPARGDYEHLSGQWMTGTVGVWDDSVIKYGRAIPGAMREYPAAPGITAIYHLARLEAIVRQHPPRYIRMRASIGPFNQTSVTDPGESLAYLKVGEYFNYLHYAAMGAVGELRLAQIVQCGVDVEVREAYVIAHDVEELIDYDLPVTDPDGSASATCATAIVITEAAAMGIGGYTIALDVTLNATDFSAPVLSCGDGVAYHAQWFSYTPTSQQKGHITTGTSDYDTVLGFLSGSCGSLTEIACNDNDGIRKTSFIDVIGSGSLTFQLGVTYKILVHGFGLEDGGANGSQLIFTLFAEPV